MGRCNGFTCHLKFGDGRTNSAEWLHSFHISQTKNHIAVWLPTGHSHCHTRTHCYSPIRLYLISRFVRKTFVLLLNIQNYFLELKTEARMVVKIGVCTVNWQEENLQNFSAQSPVFASWRKQSETVCYCFIIWKRRPHLFQKREPMLGWIHQCFFLPQCLSQDTQPETMLLCLFHETIAFCSSNLECFATYRAHVYLGAKSKAKQRVHGDTRTPECSPFFSLGLWRL